jgi:hypothetical protein
MFIRDVYPCLPPGHKYTLIIADDDASIPMGHLDVRYRGANWDCLRESWSQLVDNSDIMHIYATHLDIPATIRYSPLPVGFNPEEHVDTDIDTLLAIPVKRDILSRPLSMKCCARVRLGTQWQDREMVHNLCNKAWSSFADTKAIPKHEFFEKIQEYSFLLCPHGGGVDPNPNAFAAIYCATIPIMKRFINCEIIYLGLPVVFVDDWTPEAITIDLLTEWKTNLAPYITDDNRRAEVLRKLTADYWWEIIQTPDGSLSATSGGNEQQQLIDGINRLPRALQNIIDTTNEQCQSRPDAMEPNLI